MSEWTPKRFYEDATVEQADGGFTVRLDGRPVKTPGKRLLTMPSQAMAKHVAREWQEQQEQIDPGTMPWTRSVNSALDKVSVQRDEVMAHLIGYAGTDLLCYRADSPAGLFARQAECWNPVLDWAAQRFDVRFKVTSGVMPVAQDDEVIACLRRCMEPMTEFQLTGFHDLVTLSGSYVLALAATEKLQPPEGLWNLSRMDEDWQVEQWGVDEEAAEVAELKRIAFLHAGAFFLTA